MCKLPDGTYKFSFMEMINSGKNGMTSATGAIGVITSLVILVIFVALSAYYLFMEKNSVDIELLRLKRDGVMDILNYCTIWFGMASALLGVRNISGALGSRIPTECENKNIRKAEAINRIYDYNSTVQVDNVDYNKNETLEFNKQFSKKGMFFEQAENNLQ